jgi:hypothetical protein
LIIYYLFIIIRAAIPRYRYDQLMRLGWKFIIPLCLSYFFIIMTSILFQAEVTSFKSFFVILLTIWSLLFLPSFYYAIFSFKLVSNIYFLKLFVKFCPILAYFCMKDFPISNYTWIMYFIRWFFDLFFIGIFY